MFVEIADRVHEQMWTTAETMRRRVIAMGDNAYKFGGKVQVAGERLKDVSEPAFLDLRDYVNSACEESKPFAEIPEDSRHTLIEMYLGTSVLLIGLSLGQLAGTSSLLVPLFESVLSTYAALAILVMLPIRCSLKITKIPMDDVERRTTVFIASFLIGLMGAFAIGGNHLLPMAPSLLFLSPTILALAIDNQIVKLPESSSRHYVLIGAATVSLILSSALAYFPLRSLHMCTMLYFVAHAAFMTVHAQVSAARIQEKSFCQGQAQLIYIVGIFAIQALLAAFSG